MDHPPRQSGLPQIPVQLGRHREQWKQTEPFMTEVNWEALTDQQWRARLSTQQYNVLRKADTDLPNCAGSMLGLHVSIL